MLKKYVKKIILLWSISLLYLMATVSFAEEQSEETELTSEKKHDSYETAIDLAFADLSKGSASIHLNGYTDDYTDLIVYLTDENTNTVYSSILKSGDPQKEEDKNYISVNLTVPYGSYTIAITKFGHLPTDDKIYSFVYEPYMLIHNIDIYKTPIEFVVTDNYDTLKNERVKLSQWTRYVENFLATQIENMSKNESGYYGVSEVTYEWLGVYDTFKQIVAGTYTPVYLTKDKSDFYSNLTTAIPDMITIEEAERQGIAKIYHNENYYKKAEDIGWKTDEQLPEKHIITVPEISSEDNSNEVIEEAIDNFFNEIESKEQATIKGNNSNKNTEVNNQEFKTTTRISPIFIICGLILMIVPIIIIICLYIIKKRRQ